MPHKLIALILVFIAGLAALSWQVLWQLDLTLALGVSAQGAALTVATVMAGMTLGALWAGRRWQQETAGNPWLIYAWLEFGVGVTAWLPRVLMPAIERLDAAVYHSSPSLATPFLLLVLALTLGPACFCMGATFPLIGLIARRSGWSLSVLYGANTLGAACGSLVVAQMLLPNLGRAGASALVMTLDLTVGGLAYLLATRFRQATETVELIPKPTFLASMPMPLSLAFCALTGFVTFVLEVAWFRLLRAAWLSTSDSFAAMLFCFLLGLGLGAFISKLLPPIRSSLPVVLCLAAIAIWLGTPLIERFDLWTSAGGSYGGRMLARILVASAAMGPAILLLGVSLPALLDDRSEPRQWSLLYGVNTLGAVLGSLLAGWWLVGWLGPVKTAWAAGAVLALVAIPAIPSRVLAAQLLAIAVLVFAMVQGLDSGIGTKRVQGPTSFLQKGHRVLAHQNGPDVTTSVVRTKEGFTMLFIDGYAATGEVGKSTGYMDAMGRLPMLRMKSPQNALVICFGTGQTVRAVLDEHLQQLTVVDVNPAVYAFADKFASNHGALQDSRLQSHVMDGRSWLRRSEASYDVVTLEPMPPFFAGSNSLYSVEFYRLIEQRLRAGGYAAQWFPIHLLTTSQAKAVAAAFVQVFPNAVLWFDPQSTDSSGAPQQGILIGNKGSDDWRKWPGFARQPERQRTLTEATVEAGLMLSPKALAAYVKDVRPVTDDNQSLSFGTDGLHHIDLSKHSVTAENMAILRALSASFSESAAPALSQ